MQDPESLEQFREDISPKLCEGCTSLARQGSAFLAQNRTLLKKIDENTALTQEIYNFLNGKLDKEGLVTRVIGLEEWVKVQRKNAGLCRRGFQRQWV